MMLSGIDAVDDTLTLTTDNTEGYTGTVDVLANDTPSGELTVEQWQDVSGNFSIEWDGMGGFSVYDPGYRTIADMNAKQQEINNLIDVWQAHQTNEATLGYLAAKEALDDLNTFVDGFSGSGGLASISGSVGSLIGGFIGSTAVTVGSGIVGILADAFAGNPNASTQQILDAAEDELSDQLDAEYDAIEATAQAGKDGIVTVLQGLGNGTPVQSGSFTYTVSMMNPDFDYDDPNSQMYLYDTATVTIDATGFVDYSAHVSALQGYYDSIVGQFTPQTGSEQDDTAIYGEALKSLAEAKGWDVQLWDFVGVDPYWYAATADIPLILDATDIASELNEIEYFVD